MLISIKALITRPMKNDHFSSKIRTACIIMKYKGSELKHNKKGGTMNKSIGHLKSEHSAVFKLVFVSLFILTCLVYTNIVRADDQIVCICANSQNATDTACRTMNLDMYGSLAPGGNVKLYCQGLCNSRKYSCCQALNWGPTGDKGPEVSMCN